MFKYLGRATATHPWLVCLAWVIVAGVVSIVAPKWDERAADDDIRFLPARCDSVKGHQLLEQAFPQDVFASRLIVTVERADASLTPADFARVDGLAADLQRLRQEDPSLQISRICTYRDPVLGKRLVSGDGRCTLIQVSLNTPYMAVQTRTTVDAVSRVLSSEFRLPSKSNQNSEPRTQNSELRVHLTGPAGIGRDLIAASANSLESTTLATVILVIVILLLVHRAPVMALIPLCTIAVSVWVALKMLALCTLIPGFCMVNISQVFAVVMLYGAGTDYCLFLISRYREELTRGRDWPAALARSVGGVGGALAASAGTVICGLGLMGLAEFAKVRCGGPAIAISLAVALAASLTLTPALLRILGPIAFWPRRPPTADRAPLSHSHYAGETPALRSSLNTGREWRLEGVWGRISRYVVAHPLLIGVAALLTLMPLALIGFGVRPNYRATSELSPSSDSIRGLAAIQRHFTAGEVGPITVLLESNTDWEGPQGRAIISHLSQGFCYLDNVAEVRSLTQPLGSPVSEFSDRLTAIGQKTRGGASRAVASQAEPGNENVLLKSMWRSVVQGLTDQINRAAGDFYVARLPATKTEGPTRFVTRLDVVPRSDPFDVESVRTLELIQLWLREELPKYPGAEQVRAECHGITVNARDLAQVTESDRLRINTLVLAGIFLILLALVRRPWFALYLLASVLFSYYASLGATTLLAHWWNGRPLGLVDWRVPFFLFTILVAVGEDYNILLITRALEERLRHGPVEGIRRALSRTGGTITSCGLIMAGTFATLMLGGLSTLVQIGFALAFGVLIDTFVVRPFLVPPFALWMWRAEMAPKKKQGSRRLPTRRNLAA
ncbi:MAG TPA: MMPL family transporter [Gemmataceae bacterium]|nr:MMPL family transporter [Gemmataceae bacterium]